jgi:phage FluMu protein Com
MVTLIKGQKVHQHVPVLTGKCPSCKTLYAANHDKFEDTSTIQNTFK